MLRKSRIFVIIFFMLAIMIISVARLSRLVSTDRTIPVIEMSSESISVSVEGGDSAILKE